MGAQVEYIRYLPIHESQKENAPNNEKNANYICIIQILFVPLQRQ